MEHQPDLGPYRGFVDPEFREPPLLEQLRALPAHLKEPNEEAGPFQRSRVVSAVLTRDGAPFTVAVKVFPPQGLFRSLLARFYGSKARQSFDVAAALYRNGIGTPRPIACLERWEGRRLAESYFLTEFAEDSSTFRDELIQLYRHESHYDKILNLMDC
ncbi:MAG: hypothetical protein ACYTGK_18270, partial [Planctomycetota bacterium]